MACIHNQKLIDEYNLIITENKKMIANHNSNIEKCRSIREKHNNFNSNLECVMNKLSDITVTAGEPYDNGKMSECITKSEQTIEDCGKIITKSNAEIDKLEAENLSLETKIASLQGNCELCQDQYVVVDF